MLFTSSTFLFAFLPVLLAVYYVIPHRFRNSLLLAASLLFYAWGQPSGLLLLPLSIAVNYCVGRAIDRAHEQGDSARLAAPVRHRLQSRVPGHREVHVLRAGQPQLGAGIARARRDQVEAVRPPARHFLLHVPRDLLSGRHLWRRASAQRNIVNYGLYIALFPQLIAGPIIRYRDIAEQLTAQARHDGGPRPRAPAIFIVGLAKKLLLANVLGVYADQAFSVDARHLTASAAWLGVALLHRPDLLRFLRLLGHGERTVPAVRLSHHQQLRLSLHRAVDAGVLAALAHLAVELVPRLSLHSARRQPPRPAPHDAQSARSCSCCAASGTAPSGTSCSGGCTTACS